MPVSVGRLSTQGAVGGEGGLKRRSVGFWSAVYDYQNLLLGTDHCRVLNQKGAGKLSSSLIWGKVDFC